MNMSFEAKGDYPNTTAWLKKLQSGNIFSSLAKFGEEGRAALAAATPVESGETAAGWYYEIVQDATSWSIIWGNSHINDGQNIAVLLQYGHGTGTGGYVQGQDYINPALRGVFDRIAAEAMKVVMA